jgi:uncharacterized protein (DUF952 family)
MAVIYKICPTELWNAALAAGVFRGAPLDLADGYIHFSTLEQVRETAARHFAGQGDLVIVAVEAEALGPSLRYEPARGGQLFPHLFGPLDPALALWAAPLPLGPDGEHVFPDLSP